jgi:limonene-1,2-epoxide hydrolase
MLNIKCVCLTIFVIACPISGYAQGGNSMTDNARIIREFIEAWSRLDAQELASYFTEEGTYHNIPGSPVSGREAVAQFISGFTEHWGSTDWEILNLFADGNLVIAERVDHTVVNGSPVDLPAFGILALRNSLWKSSTIRS